MGSQTMTLKLILSNASQPSSSSPCEPDFLLVLIEALNIHLPYPIEYTGDPTQDVSHLSTQLDLATRSYFLKNYSYKFSSNPLPRRLSKPSKPFAFTDLFSCPTSTPQLIDAHILTRGLSVNNNIPRPYANLIAADLYAAMKKCLCTSPAQDWQVQVYHRIYSEDLGILPNWAIDAVWLWKVVIAVDWRKSPSIRRKFLLLNYAGVAYATKEMPDPYAE
ncbi:BgTH12-02474 [Blumeria graminis f. sp. triticale]|uniref:BgtAc-30805 n=3 Tax=Blumeria graminis TaxID=34373 RepID=A0A9X9MGQ5_BLUGR|nr:hypothetical protein BGT96224_Ac30805 [Blumeria graminis f. sp. tritici 96224]CAD6502235.1 BgTH12-02474 [Blumeria graminis f. sp. triticale]VDB86306.1 BgtAc-30805 [Blumeria graminis f. sp. tritici]